MRKRPLRYGEPNPMHARSRQSHAMGLGKQQMPPDRDNPSRWWALAAEARAVAAEMTDPQARKIMLKIAEGYERLARRAEARKKDTN